MKDSFSLPLKNIASKYAHDNIFIVGKGPSIDKIERAAFQSGLVIAINDAEWVTPADITIFHDSWVIESLQDNGFQSSLYVTDQPLPESVASIAAPYVPPEQESSELIVQRFHSDTLEIEDTKLITALKIAGIIGKLRMRRQRVYLIGFDFDTSAGNSRAVPKDYSGEEKSFQSQVISLQEHYLLMFMFLLKESELQLTHIGSKAYSTKSIESFNKKFGDGQNLSATTPAPKVEAETPDVDSAEKVEIVAELTTNHFGNTDSLIRMIELAAAAGADFVKVQKRDVATFYTEAQLETPYDSPFGTTFGDYRKALELSDEQFAILEKECARHGIGWFLSVLDFPSFQQIQPMNLPRIKLPSTISQHREFLKTVSTEYKGAVVISTGYTSQDYEDFVLDAFTNSPQLYLLQCNSAYPTPPQDCHISVIRRYGSLTRTHPNVIPGYSSHDLGSEGSRLAVAAGAKMIEKHVKLGDTPWAHFDSVAQDLGNGEFTRFVEDVRRAEMICGNEEKRVNDSEHHKYWVR